MTECTKLSAKLLYVITHPISRAINQTKSEISYQTANCGMNDILAIFKRRWRGSWFLTKRFYRLKMTAVSSWPMIKWGQRIQMFTGTLRKERLTSCKDCVVNRTVESFNEHFNESTIESGRKEDAVIDSQTIARPMNTVGSVCIHWPEQDVELRVIL